MPQVKAKAKYGRKQLQSGHSGAIGALVANKVRWEVAQNDNGTYYINEYSEQEMTDATGSSPMTCRDTLLDGLSLNRAQRIVVALEAAQKRVATLVRTITPYHRLPVEIC